MRDFSIFAVLLFLLFAVNMVQPVPIHDYGDEAVMVLGFVLLIAWLAGRLTARMKMPMITGYLLAGLFFGPYVLEKVNPNFSLFSKNVLEQLSLFDDLALGLIAFTAGGELRMKDLRARFKTIGMITLMQAIVVLVGIGIAVFFAMPLLPFLAGKSTAAIIAASLLLGMAAAALSPATTVAVINELHAKGPISEIMMAVSVFMDVVILILFTVGLIIATRLLNPDAPTDLFAMLLVVWESVGSLGIGLLLGALLGFVISYLGRDLPILILTIAFLAVYLAEQAHLSGLLICMASGFYIENYTRHGERLIEAIERFSLPVYIVFFTIAGARINITALQSLWVIVLLLVGTRMLLTFFGTWTASRLTGGNKQEQRLVWMGFVGQAGVTLGIASIIGREIPDIGRNLQTLIVATIAVNQIIGPILQRFALIYAGEAKPFD